MKPHVSAIRFQPDGDVYLDIRWTAERSPEYAHTAILRGPDGRNWLVSVREQQPEDIPASQLPPAAG